MAYSPILTAHICAGTVGLLSGTAAIGLRKGSRQHALAGKVFVASMLSMGVAAVYLAVVRHQPNNVGGGILTFYLIGTAWLTAKRRHGETNNLDWIVSLVPLTLGVLTWIAGMQALRNHAELPGVVPVGMSFFMGTVMLLAAAGDVRMLRHSGRATHRAASLANVFRAIHRRRVFFSGTLQSAIQVAFRSRARQTSVPGFL